MKLSLLIPSLTQGRRGVYLLYGQEGLIHGLLREVMALFPYQVLPSDQLLAHAQGILTPSIFGKTPSLTLSYQVNVTLFSSVVTQWPKEETLLVTATAPSSPLARVETLACYGCSLEESRTILKRHIGREKVNLTSEALEICAEWTRKGTWAEISSTLSLYQEDPITPEILFSLFAEEPPDLLLAFLCRKKEFPMVKEERTLLQGWQKIILQLWQLKILSQTLSWDQATKRVSPPLFFRHIPLLRKALSDWSEDQLAKAMEVLVQQESAIKQNLSHGAMNLSRFLMNTCRILELNQ